MKRIYKVRYKEKWTGCGEWISGNINVLGNGNMDNVIKKAKQHCIGQTYKDVDNKIQRCVGFRVMEITVLAESEI